MFKKQYLDNGIPVVMERIRNVRSVSLGIWVKVGSRNETRGKSGISHFLEHMFFKGTRKRSARDLAVEIDSLGGDLNAFTSKESTTFYVKILDDYIDKGIDLLADIFLNSTFPEDEIDKEKGVVREEIKMVEDNPDDFIHDIFNNTVWGDDGLGQPILGNSSTVMSFSRSDLVGHIRKYYGVRDTVVACAGNFEPEKLIGMLNRGLGGLRRGSEASLRKSPSFKPKVHVHTKKLSEVHICLGVRGIPQASPERYTMFIINTILGAGLSSRLFQEVRENRGLTYSIYSFISSYFDTGLLAVYAGTSKKHTQEVIRLTVGEMRSLRDTVTPEEVERAKDQLKGNLILGLESTSNRMQNIARQEIYYGRYYSPDEIMANIDKVDLNQVREFSDRYLSNGKIAVTLLGPIEGRHVIPSLPPL